MKTFQTFGLAVLLMLASAFPAIGQQKVVRQATDAEASGGTDVSAYINPRQLQTYGGGGGGGGPTNGITAVTATNISKTLIATTNNNIIQPNINATSNAIVSGLNWGQIAGGTVHTNPDIATFYTIQDPTTGSRLAQFNQAYFYVQATNPASASFPDFAEIFVNNGSSSANRKPQVVVQGDNGMIQYRPSVGGTGYTSTLDGTGINSDGPVNAASVSVTTATASTLTTTNFYTATNDLTGVTVIDLAAGSEGTIKLAADWTITGFQNAVAGVVNDKLVNVIGTNANKNVSVPASWKPGKFNTGVVTNGTVATFWFHMQLGAFTNWYQLDTQ